MGTNQELLNFEGNAAADNTKRLIYNVTPVQNVMPFIQGPKLAADIGNKNKALEREYVYKHDGLSEILTTDQELVQVMNALSMYHFRLENDYIADLHSGLYTMLTQNPENFAGYQPTYYGNGAMKSVVIFTTLKTAYKAAFGPLVSKNGTAIKGAYDIIDNAKRILMPILAGKNPMPRARASFQIRDQKTQKLKRAFMEGEPLHVLRLTKNYGDIIAIELDADFTPLQVKNNKIIAKDTFIHSVAGLTAFLQYGKILTPGASNRGLQAKSAKKVITAIQTASELGEILGFSAAKINASGRLNAIVKRDFIRNVTPDAVDSKGYIEYKKASSLIAMAGQYYLNAIEATGILEEISAPKLKIFIPATDKAVEFPKEFQNIVYLKAEPLRGGSIAIGREPEADAHLYGGRQ